MSWLDAEQNEFIVKTPDGREHRPKWAPLGRSKDFNAAEFEFPEKTGTLVYKGKRKGTRYNFDLVFDGEDHLDLAEVFWDSADDSRPWVVSHPYYGSITVQCIALIQENSAHNISRFTGVMIETITDTLPKMSVDPVDRISGDKILLDAIFAESFASTVTPSPTDVNTMNQNTASVYNIGKKRVLLTENAEEYFNLFNTANSYITEASSEPLAAMRAVQAVVNYPSLFQDSVYSRLKIFEDQISVLRVSLDTMTDPSKKRIFQTYLGAIISSMAYTSANPQDGDYETSSQVYGVVDRILTAYNQFVTDLDALKTPNGGELDSFIPDAESIMGLNEIINFTLSNLFGIALDSKQERTVYIEADSNIILMAHRFYGLGADNTTLQSFVNSNAFGINDILGLKKGRPVKYYV